MSAPGDADPDFDFSEDFSDLVGGLESLDGLGGLSGSAGSAGAQDPAGVKADGSELSAEARLTAWVRGRVQGVGFRWWVRRNALELGLLGFAENLVDGRVKIIAEGARDSLTELLGRLEGPGAPGQVAQVTFRWDQLRGGFTSFVER